MSMLNLYFLEFFACLCFVLGTELRVLFMIDRYSATELRPKPLVLFLFLFFSYFMVSTFIGWYDSVVSPALGRVKQELP